MRFVQTKRYLRDLKRLGASDLDVARLEQAIADDPTVGDVIPGLEGLRKVRFGLGSRGKRGGGRAIYFLMVADDLVVFVAAFAKSEKENLSPQEKKYALALLKEFKDAQS